MTERDHIDRFLEQIREDLPELDLEVEGIVDRVSGLSRRFHKQLDDTVAEFGLTSGEWKVLGALHRGGSKSPGRLAEMFELSSGAMTNRLDRLEEQKLIKRLPDPDDRRGVRLELTSAGRQRYKETVHSQAAKEAFVAGALTPREQQQLNALLRKVMLAFERSEPGKFGSS
jgi:DNA-binding MarR family transcriptional regulator